MESLPRLIVPGAPQPGFNPQPLILGTGQGLPGIGQGMDPGILTPAQLAIEEQKHRWFLSQLPYPLARVQPLERDIGPQAPVPAWGELPVVDWRSKLYDTPPPAPADPDAAVADAVGRRSNSIENPQLNALYGGLATSGAPEADPRFKMLADPGGIRNVQQLPQRPGQLRLMPARDLTVSPVSGGAVLAAPVATAPAASSPLGNAAKIEGAIAGTQSQTMAPGSGGPVLTAPGASADNGVNRPAAGAAAGDGISALDVAVLGAESLADPIVNNVSDGGPGTSTAKGNSAIDAKLNQRINAFLARNGVTPVTPYQLPLRTGMSAGTTAAAPATAAAAGGGSPPNNPPNNPPDTPLDDLVDDAANPAGRAPGSGNPRGGRAQRTRPGAGQTMDAILSAPDLGLGYGADKMMRRAGAAARNAGMNNVGRALFRAGGAARVLAPAAALASPLIPAAMGAVEGYADAGAGGAVIQGGSGLAGAAAGAAIGSFILPGIGTVIGGGLGAMLGGEAGKGITGLAKGAVDAAQGGDTGLMGQIGRTLDPVIDSEYERQQRQVMRDMNSPAMKAIELQQQRREAQARADRAQALLMQSYLS